ncbi:MAG: hypothetical protein PHH87_11095 [Desulfuromonas sp.]|nr:hypothetical protein [Desulfuromonas sp.]
MRERGRFVNRPLYVMRLGEGVAPPDILEACGHIKLDVIPLKDLRVQAIKVGH